jgi:hypothetical protein
MYSPTKENLNVRLGNKPSKLINKQILKGRRTIKTIKEIEDFYSIEFISK